MQHRPHKVATNNASRCNLKLKATPEANVPEKPCRKRGPEMSIDDQRWKKQKMDCNVKVECSNLLKVLMDRRLAWAFARPFDPVKTPPDYFKRIKNPMDLGTIKRKLERNMYSAAKEFADDMLLTFGNAMAYHPPSSEVYRNARLLDCNFRRRWEILAAKVKLVVENNHHQVAGLMKATMAEKHGKSRRVASTEGVQMSPKKALQVATLKSRFADTIFKATQ
ncbi:hypothetical protein SASPL_130227 [Salvia splendens]|uniref:Bromo domain-containing protein n=2 Tax=Salvia splendens TaxID=180675 RepID=A0A8X8X5A2_SALSN|nr:hypothetical protein SASPL_130227 [Salvia splendens]